MIKKAAERHISKSHSEKIKIIDEIVKMFGIRWCH